MKLTYWINKGLKGEKCFVEEFDNKRDLLSPIYGVDHKKELPDIRTLNDKYEKVNTKRKQKAWLRIRSKIIYAAKHGNRHVQIWPEDYIDIPYDEFKGELESHGYVLEAHSKMWYRERVSIGVSWED